MIISLENLLKRFGHNAFYKSGIKVIKVKNPEEGIKTAENLLIDILNKNSVLFLSGGKTPKSLYELLAKEQKLRVGAAALVDERYIPKSKIPPSPRLRGASKRQKSKIKGIQEGTNEKMIRDTGLIQYIENIARFYPILEDKTVGKSAKDYDKIARFLLEYFPKSIGILGIGEDGHTAGLPSRSQKSKVKGQKYVTAIDNFPGEFKDRITLNFNALAKMDFLLVLVFGSAKQTALRLMFAEGSFEEIPARFYLLPDIAKKTLLITDQDIK